MAGYVLSLLVLSVGLSALAVHVLRLKSKDRTLLWFGLFIFLYGLRSLCYHTILRTLFDVPAGFWRYLSSIISDVIVIPALLFFECIYGRGWKSSLQWLMLAQAVWAVAAIAADIVRHDPGGTPDPSNLQLVTLPVLLIIGHVRGYRPPRSSWAAIMFAGVFLFLVSVMVDRLFASEQIRMRPGADQVQVAAVQLVNQQPVGFDVAIAAPDAFAAFIRSDFQYKATLIRNAHVQAE